MTLVSQQHPLQQVVFPEFLRALAFAAGAADAGETAVGVSAAGESDNGSADFNFQLILTANFSRWINRCNKTEANDGVPRASLAVQLKIRKPNHADRTPKWCIAENLLDASPRDLASVRTFLIESNVFFDGKILQHLAWLHDERNSATIRLAFCGFSGRKQPFDFTFRTALK